MTASGNLVRRKFGPLVLSVQVLVDLLVILLACWTGYHLREYVAWSAPTDFAVYREIFLLTAAVTLICFYAFGMYRPLEGREQGWRPGAIAKSSIVSFLVVHMLLVMLRGTSNLGEQGLYKFLVLLHKVIDLEGGLEEGTFWLFSRLTMVAAFFLIFLFTTISRFISFRAIQVLSRRGVGGCTA